MKFSKPTTISNEERRTIGSIQPGHLAPQISAIRPDRVRERYAIKFGSGFIGLDVALQMRVFMGVERAQLFMTSDRAWEIAKELPEVGGQWMQRTKYDVVPVYVTDPVCCTDTTDRQ